MTEKHKALTESIQTSMHKLVLKLPKGTIKVCCHHRSLLILLWWQINPRFFFCARFSPLQDSASRRPAVVKHRPHRPEERVIGTRVNPSTSAPLPPNAGNQPCQPLADGEGGHKSQYRINQLNRLPESWLFMVVGGDSVRMHLCLVYTVWLKITEQRCSAHPTESPFALRGQSQ